MSKIHTDSIFYKINVGDCQDIASEVGIRAMPTFAFYKGGNELKRITGWQPSIITDMVTQSMTDYYLK